MSKECRMNDGPRGCWTGSQIEEGKEEDQEEPGEGIYKQRWNGEICVVEIGKIENYGMQDAENGDSCKKTRFIYIYIYSTFNSCPILMKLEFSRHFFERYKNIKFHDNLSSGSRVVLCGQKDGQTS